MKTDRRDFISGVFGFFGVLALPAVGIAIEPRKWDYVEFKYHNHFPNITTAFCWGQRNDGQYFFAAIRLEDIKHGWKLEPAVRRHLDTYLEADCHCGKDYICDKHQRLNPGIVEEED